MTRFPSPLLLILLLISAAIHSATMHSAVAQQSFQATWKLLNTEEKQQFIAGYIKGWGDAEEVTEIAIRYIKENPGKAVEGLEQIRKLYHVSPLNPATVVGEIDRFYGDAENGSASLSKALSTARSNLTSGSN